jgi:hypothetical protein
MYGGMTFRASLPVTVSPDPARLATPGHEVRSLAVVPSVPQQ